MGCEHAQAAGGQTSPSQFEENTLSEVKRVIAVLSGKGGVGKSFVTGAIATELSRHGHKVGVLDADITGPSIPKMFGMSGRHVHALGNLMLPEISEHGVKIMSSNLLLQNETDPVLWRGPVIAGAIRQFWSETSWPHRLPDGRHASGNGRRRPHRLPVAARRWHRHRHEPAGSGLDDRRQGGQHGREDERPHSGNRRKHELYRVPRLRQEDRGLWQEQAPRGRRALQPRDPRQLPINPALAEACDKGEVETALPDGMLPQAVSAVEAIAPHETAEA